MQRRAAQRAGGPAPGRATAGGAARHVRCVRGQLPGARQLRPGRPGRAGAAGVERTLCIASSLQPVETRQGHTHSLAVMQDNAGLG